MSLSVSAVPVIGVLWYDQQALSCSVQPEPGRWSVSLWQAGLPDPDSQEQPQGSFRMVRTGQQSLPLDKPGTRHRQTRAGLSLMDCSAYVGQNSRTLNSRPVRKGNK